MSGTGKCKGEGLGPGGESLCLSWGPIRGTGVCVQGSLYKNNYWREEDRRQRSVGSRRPPNQLSNNIPLGQATYPQLPTPRPTGPWEEARELLPHCSCTKEIEHF